MPPLSFFGLGSNVGHLQSVLKFT